MPKVLLVEDDNNLREIYGARLMAEGFEIVSAADGEEALALAVKQKPDLIISDVMMPKISGFDMLDILRTTPETKTTKVIMMTALSQPEDRERGVSLGADKYLVKSQVTLEDVVNAVHEVLGDTTAAPTPATPAADPVPAPEPETVEPAPAADPVPASEPETVEPDPAPKPDPIPTAEASEEEVPEDPPMAPQTQEEPETSEPEEPAEKTTEVEDDRPKKKIIKPINDLKGKPGIVQLAKDEEAREKASEPGAVTDPQAEAADGLADSIAKEKEEMEAQIEQFVHDAKSQDSKEDSPAEPDTDSDSDSPIEEAVPAEPVPAPPAPEPTPDPAPKVPAPEPKPAEPAPTPEPKTETPPTPVPTPAPEPMEPSAPTTEVPDVAKSGINPDDVAL